MFKRTQRGTCACLLAALLVACSSTPSEGPADGSGEITSSSAEQSDDASSSEPEAASEVALVTPPSSELAALIASSLLELKAALETGDFEAFRAASGAPITSNYTAAQLKEQMATFAGKEAQIAKVRESEPVFEPSPGIDEDGVLRLVGHYPTQPERVAFELNYTHEGEGWKLAGLSLRFERTLPKAPTEEQIRRLLTASLQSLAQALEAEDFEGFHHSLARRFQEETTAQQLQESFGALTAEQAALDSAVRLPAAWRVAPQLDAKGELVASAFYATQPRRLRVDARYTYQDDAWKALGLVVKLEPIPSRDELWRLVHTNLLALNQALTTGDFEGFHQSMAAPFKAEFDVAKLQELIEGFDGRELLGAIEGKSPLLDRQPELEGDRVLTLTGHYETAPRRLSFTLRFLQESEQWRLAGISLNARHVPSAEETQRLLQSSVFALAEALQSNDFRALRDGAAAALREKYTPEQLGAVFASLSEHHETLRQASKAKLGYTGRPVIDASGDLHLAGEFQSAPAVPFKATFRYEGEAWKLLDISVSIRRAGAALPAEAELVALTKATLLEFDRGVKAKDLGPFYRSQCAERFKAKVSLDRLHQAFRGFMDAGNDIASLEGLAPTFEPAPSLRSGGVLSLSGVFPTEPKRVAFKLRFDREAESWRVVGIEVFLR